MNHYNYNGSSSLHAVPGQQQHLTPISSVTSHPYHQDDSPASPHILPPLHPSGHPSSYSTAFKDDSHASPHAQHSSEHTPDLPPLPHLGAQHHMNPADRHHSYASLDSFPSSSNHAYAAPANAQSGMSNGHTTTTTHQSLPHLTPAIFGGAGYERSNGLYGAPPPYQPSVQQQQQQQQQGGQDQRPVPVVGSQGRRGILPSAPGRAPATASSLEGSDRASLTPTKNTDNKYPCQYCTKTYLHLKHLKRHHLRHTGERPYQCSLCNETFCRSDILKRHFTKCSQRRGNPSGLTHLTHAQAHLRPNQNHSSAPAPALPPPPPSQAPNGMVAPQTLPQVSPQTSSAPNFFQSNPRTFGNFHGEQIPLSSHPMGEPTASTRSSRSSSIMRPGSSSDEEQRKRFSSSSNLAPINGSADTSPQTGAGSERSFSMGFGQRDAHTNGYYTNGGPAQQHHSEQTLPSMAYPRQGFLQYQNPTNDHMQHSWASAFQPGAAHDTMMYTGH